jgi:hypothetical protein
LALGNVLACLWGTAKHLNEVIVKAVVQLALELPGELRRSQLSRMKLKDVGVDRNWRVLEADQDFDGFALCSSIEAEQWVIVKRELIDDSLEIAGNH